MTVKLIHLDGNYIAKSQQQQELEEYPRGVKTVKMVFAWPSSPHLLLGFPQKPPHSWFRHSLNTGKYE